MLNTHALRTDLLETVDSAKQEMEYEETHNHNWQEHGEAKGRKELAERLLKEYF